jgi:phosphate starvation-inducible PhoH-like protein
LNIYEEDIDFPNEISRLIAGDNDQYLALIEAELGMRIIPRGNIFTLSGSRKQINKAKSVMNQIRKLYSSNEIPAHKDVKSLINIYVNNSEAEADGIVRDTIIVGYKGKSIRPKTMGQKIYVESLRKNELVFAIGPAGTGKTFLAIALAVLALNRRECARIVLTRPAVEAGERLGFLPGDMQEKVDPYLRPLYDALSEIMGPEKFARNLERGIIEVAPLAYMRGRTLENAFIILDEAQNTTSEQMKMFLTRMGFGSKIVVTGDITQIDLPYNKPSGLIEAIKKLENISGLDIVHLSSADVVRHPLVQRIIDAYSS